MTAPISDRAGEKRAPDGRGQELYADGLPGFTPGRYLMNTVWSDGTAGPDVIVTVHEDLSESWEKAPSRPARRELSSTDRAFIGSQAFFILAVIEQSPIFTLGFVWFAVQSLGGRPTLQRLPVWLMVLALVAFVVGASVTYLVTA